MKKALLLLILIGFLGGVFLSSCDQGPKQNVYTPEYTETPISTQTTLILGVHPLFNPKKLYHVFTPLAQYLNQKIPEIYIKVEASKDYPAYDRKIQQEKFDLLLPNPYQTTIAMKSHYKVIAQAGENEQFRGIILVRRDSGINQVTDLKGKTIAYPAPTALAATMMPQYFLTTHGLNLTSETKTLYVGSQESSIMNTYLKLSDASATWPLPWQQLQQNKPEIANQLKVAWQTDTLPNNSVMYCQKRVPPFLAKKIQQELLNLHQTAQGQAILKEIGIPRFLLADNQTYQPVYTFLQNFNQQVGDNSAFDTSKEGVR